MTTSTSSGIPADTAMPPATRVAPYRVAADIAQRWLSVAGFAICAIQVAFAALGFWGSQTNPGDESVGRAAFEPHAITGQVLQYLAVVLLILGLVAMSGWKAWVIPLVLAVLLFAVQGMLVGLGFGASPWFGALHAFDGMIITAGLVWLALDRFRHPLRPRA